MPHHPSYTIIVGHFLVTQEQRQLLLLATTTWARTALGGSGSLSAHAAVAMGRWVVYGSQRHVLGRVVEDAPPIAPPRENTLSCRIGQSGGHSYAEEACITHSSSLGQEALEGGVNWQVVGPGK